MMEFSSTLKKSFKSHHGRKISIEDADQDPHREEQPILSRPPMSSTSSPSSPPSSSGEVIVKIDGQGQQNNNIWREPSYDYFWNNKVADSSGDPPSRLIGQFLKKQRAAGMEMSLDVDLEMNELRPSDRNNFPPDPHHHINRNNNDGDSLGGSRRINNISKDLRVSFRSPLNDNHNDDNDKNKNDVIDIEADDQKQQNYYSHQQQYSSSTSTTTKKEIEEFSSDDDDDGNDDYDNGKSKEYPSRRRSNADGNGNWNDTSDPAQVVRCSSVQRRTSVLGRLKTKSRLIDPSPERPVPVPGPDRRSGGLRSSGQVRSGMLGRISGMLGVGNGNNTKQIAPEDEEDDPLFDEDLPEEYRKAKLNALTLLQWISLVLIVTSLSCTLGIPKWKRRTLRGLRLWKWEVLILVLICGRLVSGWGIRIVVVLIERNFVLRKRVLYFVYGIRKAVQNCIWLGLVLIAWHYMFDKKVEGNNDFLKYVNKLMVCMLVATLLWLVKTLMVKVLASSFHVSTFFDRIQESLFNQYVIEMLSGPPVIEIKSIQEEEDRTMAEIQKLQNAGATLPPDLRPPYDKSGRMRGVSPIGGVGLPPRPSRALSVKVSGPISKNQDDPGITIDHLHRLNPKNISAWNMKRLMNMVRHGVLSTLDEQIMGTTQQDESTTLIRSEFEAKVAARKIFRNVAKPRAKYIYLEDLMRFLREEEALKTMNIVEGSTESERISKASLKDWVVNAFRERRALALTLNDTKTAVNKLHRMVNILVGIIIVIICLVILEIATSKFLLFVSSQIVVVAFVFGNTCKTIFEALIFLFVMHPFDVGDRCEIDGTQMIVEEMNILTTVFLRYDNQKIIFPNSTLSTKAISNYYRSPDMTDTIDFLIHIATPAEKIAIMKQRITSLIENKKDHWYGAPSVVVMNMQDLNSLKMSVWIRHRMNHQDMTTRWIRRGLLIEEMIKIFKELDIEYRLYPLDINVRSLPPPVNSTRIPSTWPPSAD
ncbi:OLC1v1003515C3 [Oldenlandia corymbosa var. corymbosa]|uniref:Mechanosensitive ion channel protein n=1 Tax=Oldenlandia corymbosa var. corymbosa TaxID=529605 RepID=A0AAV1DAZ7_OLDCO|nr:OLC1v1003515C3 [Oldenlandia corymbosa var. corymbosa]